MSWLSRGPAHELLKNVDGSLTYRFVGREGGLSSEEKTRLQGLVSNIPISNATGEDETGALLRHVDDPQAHWLGPQTEMTAAQVAWLIENILKALQPLHASGVYHGAIRADRIGVSDDSVWLTDAGIVEAYTLATGEHLRVTSTGYGSLFSGKDIVPPEMLAGEPLQAASDIFLLGAIGHRLLTGTDPFGDGSAMTRYRRIRVGDYTLLSTTEYGAIASWLNDCLSSNPADRPSANSWESLELPTTRWEPTPDDKSLFSERFKACSLQARRGPFLEKDPRVEAKISAVQAQLEAAKKPTPSSQRRRRMTTWILAVATVFFIYFVLDSIGDELEMSRRDPRPGPKIQTKSPRPRVTKTSGYANIRRPGERSQRVPRRGLETLISSPD